jgi:spermidine synthase
MPALLLFLTGFAGLVHEVVWARWFALSYGGTAPAAAAVLAAYLGGLAIGAAWLGRIGDRAGSPPRLFALLQLGVALCGAGLLLVPAALPPLYAAMAPAGAGATALGLARFALAALFLLLPAFLMGGALPIAARWAATGREGSAARVAGRLRAANCLGAAAGAVAAAWLLIPSMGLTLSVTFAAGLNFAAAAIAFLLAREPQEPAKPAKPGKPAPKQKDDSGRTVPWPAALVLAGFAGALALSVELAQMRAIVFYSSSTIRAFAAVSAVSILALGAGAFLGGRLIRKPAAVSAAPALAVLLALAGALAGLSVPTLAAAGPMPERLLPTGPVSAKVLRELAEGSFWTNLTTQFRPLRLALVGCAPTMLALGAAFPLLVHLLAPAAGRVGRSVGGAAAALDLGSVAGPVLGALVLLPLLGTKWTLAGLGVLAVIVAAILAFWAARNGARLGLAGRWLIILALPAAVLPAARSGLYGPEALAAAAGAGAEVTVDSQDEGLEAVVTVAEGFEPWEDRQVRRLFIGHKMQADETTPWLRVEKRMGALPALLCPATSGRTLHIGLGSGITAAWSAAAAPGRSVECAELVPGVVRAQEFFRPHNSRGPVTVTVADGRSRLLAERGQFELIVTDIVFPEDAGAGGLYSVEYFRLAKSRLAENGVFAHWLPLFQLPPEAFKAVVRSFLEVFPDATLWAGCLDANRPVVMLLGGRGAFGEVLNLAVVAPQIKATGLKPAELAELGLDSPEAVQSHFACDGRLLREFVSVGALSTDDQPLAETLTAGAAREHANWGALNLQFLLNVYHRGYARVWADGGRFEDIKRFRDPRYQLAQAGLAVAVGQDGQALELLRKARELSPKDPEIAYALWSLLANIASGLLEGERPQPAAAQGLLEEALKCGPMREFMARDLAKAKALLEKER